LFNDIFVWNVFVFSPITVDHLIEVRGWGGGQNSQGWLEAKALRKFFTNF
jgi:hypothetical protein